MEGEYIAYALPFSRTIVSPVLAQPNAAAVARMAYSIACYGIARIILNKPIARA